MQTPSVGMPMTHRAKAVPRLVGEQPGRWQRIRDLLWLVGVAARKSPRTCLLWTAVVVAQGLLIPVQLWTTKAFVDAITAQFNGQAGQGGLIWLGGLIAALLLDRLCAGVQPWLQAKVRERVGPGLQQMVMQKAVDVDLVAFEHQEYHNQLSRVMSDAEVRGPQVLQQVLQVLGAVPAVVAYCVALVTLTPTLLLIAAGATAASVVGWLLSGQSYWSLLRSQTREHRLADYYAGILMGRDFAKEVRLYELSGYLLQNWQSLFWKTRNQRRRLALRQALRQRGIILLSDGAIMFGLWWVVAAGLTKATAGQYALLFQSINGLIQRIFGLSGTLQALGEQSGYASDFRAFMQIPAREQAPVVRRTFPEQLKHGIRFEDVWFTYPGCDFPALAGVSFELRAGEKVAVVGENGAGKSTLVKLLLGLYQPDAGRITFDGRDVREIDPTSLVQAMSAVFQNFVRYPLTFGENVGLGDLQLPVHPNRLAEAVSKAGAEGILHKLDHGYDTVLGPDVGGVDLSGGQWQRVALARGFFRNAQVLVLDEPTAALDPLAELAVFERFLEMARGCTAVLISHRLGMARLADRVLVLANGRLVEQGTHQNLLRAGGEYATLFEAQARWYQ
ncbi:MAG TPA: ABC transporter ATP-binding protein [Symbiobacteriaceae bacterium]|jgi:ATP-binding cassette subfamily B protein|nr:ABC transporter ATP-binding protein [Symbiobacteriaceae bacterium]